MSEPTSGPEARPQPQYGEYATPEQQRAAIRRPHATAALEAGVSPDDAPPAKVRRPPAIPLVPGRLDRGQLIDRIAALALLAYGAFVTFSSLFAFADLAAYFDRVYVALGIPGEFTNLEAAAVWGPIGAVTIGVGFAATAWTTSWRLRGDRSAWWVPLLGAVVTHVFVFACIWMPLVSDKAFVAWVMSAA